MHERLGTVRGNQSRDLGRDGDTLIVLLGGGIKNRQQEDIKRARRLWREYKRRKRQRT